MHFLRDGLALIKGQARNLGQALRNRPIRPVSFVSMTLDLDDVEIAEQLLAKPSLKHDFDPVEAFERDFSDWIGAEQAAAFASGREALYGVLRILGIQEGDEIIVPAYTCVVVPNACRAAGAAVVWADIELDTYGLDVESVEQVITRHTRAIIVQHLYGLVCRDYEALLELANRRGLLVIEDCAHSTGARHNGTAVGLRGDAGFYSSEHSKGFTTFQGGVAVARDDGSRRKLAELARSAPIPDNQHTQGCLRALISEYWQHKSPHGWWRGSIEKARAGKPPAYLTALERNGGWQHGTRRLPPQLAMIGSNQITKLEGYNARRRSAAARWDKWCDQRGYKRPLVTPGSAPTFLRYPVLVEAERKRRLDWGVREFGSKPGVWFLSHIHPVPSSIPGVPRADEAVARCINLPCLFPDK